jgi:hypothetical protein
VALKHSVSVVTMKCCHGLCLVQTVAVMLTVGATVVQPITVLSVRKLALFLSPECTVPRFLTQEVGNLPWNVNLLQVLTRAS